MPKTLAPKAAETVTPAGPTFELVDVPPASVRTAVFNPYAAKVTELISRWDDVKGTSTQAIRFTVPTATLPLVGRQLANAATEHGKSMRQQRTIDGENTVIIATAVNKILRPPTDATVAKRAAAKAAKLTVEGAMV